MIGSLPLLQAVFFPITSVLPAQPVHMTNFSGPPLLTLVPLSWSHVKQFPLFLSGMKPFLSLHFSVPVTWPGATTLPLSTLPLCVAKDTKTQGQAEQQLGTSLSP